MEDSPICIYTPNRAAASLLCSTYKTPTGAFNTCNGLQCLYSHRLFHVPFFTMLLQGSFLFMSTLMNPEQSYKHNLLPVCFTEHRWAFCPQIFNFLVPLFLILLIYGFKTAGNSVNGNIHYVIYNIMYFWAHTQVAEPWINDWRCFYEGQKACCFDENGVNHMQCPSQSPDHHHC